MSSALQYFHKTFIFDIIYYIIKIKLISKFPFQKQYINLYSRILQFLNNLDIHCDIGTNNGAINFNDDIYLTDNQSIYISDKEKIIFE